MKGSDLQSNDTYCKWTGEELLQKYDGGSEL